MKEYLILLSGMNEDNEITKYSNIIVLADNSSEANEKADRFMSEFDDELCWDVQQCTELTDVIKV